MASFVGALRPQDLYHTGIIVPDLDAAMARLSAVAGYRWIKPLTYTRAWQVLEYLRTNGVDPEQVGAFILEPYQGWSARLLEPRLVDAIWGVALACGALVIADEVQAGMGRTGQWWGHQHFPHRPDLVVCGKALGNGVPIAAVLGSGELLARVPDLSATHSGHPLGCAAALASLDVLETERLVDRAGVLGDRIQPRLIDIEEQYPDIAQTVAGVGAVWALHVGNRDRANAVVDVAFRRGLLLVRTQAGTVKFGPPLTVRGDELDAMLDILPAAVAEVAE